MIKKIKGFAICGADGVYYAADAEIVSEDTVKLSNKDITDPKAVSYSYSKLMYYSNLYSSRGSKPYLPAVPFVTDTDYHTHFASGAAWMDCDDELIWKISTPEKYTGLYNPWECNNCTYSVSDGSAYSGNAGLSVAAKADSFSLSQIFSAEYQGDYLIFHENDRNWSNYGFLSFFVRNTSEGELSFDCCKINCIDGSSFVPKIDGKDSTGMLIPSDGNWHEIRLKLDMKVKSYVAGFSLEFTGENMDFDQFGFHPN